MAALVHPEIQCHVESGFLNWFAAVVVAVEDVVAVAAAGTYTAAAAGQIGLVPAS